jgi:asparagine synthase (glutamine-hydrolysing)
MCGFLFEFSNYSIKNHDELMCLLEISKKRGPDSTSSISPTPNTWFGFNRLAIQDLSNAGNQPMLSDDGLLTLVFNGEIYNHIEIRKNLNKRNWRGHSDTETILAAIVEWGFDKTIDALDGMFAIACYNTRDNSMSCARDFAGIKPFFYGWDGNTFVGASQYNQVIKHSKYSNKDIDTAVMRLYLEQHFIPAPFGIYKDTGQLEPGEIIHIRGGKIIRYKYWEFPEFQEPTIYSKNQALELIQNELNVSIKSQLISDVPLGAFLSGGIDSPLVSWFAKQNLSNLDTFTIGSDSVIHDETEDAQTYARLIGSKNHSKRLTSDEIISDLQQIMECVTEPMADFSIIPTYLVSRHAKEKVTVALSGDGGDELFFGYERFWSIAKNIKYQHYPWAIKAALYGFEKYYKKDKRINSVILSNSQSLSHRRLHSRFDKTAIELLFPHLQGVKTPKGYKTYNYSNKKSELELIQSMRKAEFYGMMQKTLRKVDLASMGNSLEVRVPFLKKSFIEASLKIDPMLSFGSGRKKELLKELVKNKISQAPIDNRKRGFSVPLGSWLTNKELMKAMFVENESRLVNTFGMDKLEFQKLQNRHLNREIDAKWPLFTLSTLPVK